eukprot:4066527-Amphidinium_carterae.1
MSAVMTFKIDTNSFEGALPASGLQVMRLVSDFFIYSNGFKGGISSMSAVTQFAIHVNHFEGALPASGLKVMR